MNNLVYTYFCIFRNVASGKLLKVALLGQKAGINVVFVGIATFPLEELYQFVFLPKLFKSPCFPQPYQQKMCNLSLQFFTIQWYLNVVFICISLNMSEFEHLFICLRATLLMYLFLYVVNYPFMSVLIFLLCFQSFEPQF